MGNKERANNGDINLSLDGYHERFLKDHPEINASAVFRGSLDDMINKMGWSPDDSDEDWAPEKACGTTTENATGEPQAATQDDD